MDPAIDTIIKRPDMDELIDGVGVTLETSKRTVTYIIF